MKNILLQRIQNASLTKTERRIADYFLKNYEEIGLLSSSELAKKIGVSDASIIRFSRTIGYSGFLELKSDIYLHLVTHANNQPSNKRPLTERFDIDPTKASTADISQQFLDIAHDNIDETFQQNSPEVYAQIAELLLTSQAKYIVGLRGCKGIAMQFARLLQFFANRVIEISTTDSDTTGYLMDIGPNDILLMFVLSRYYKADMPLIKMAYERKAKICIVTDSMVAPVVPFADFLLIAKTSRMSFFHSTVGINMIAEYLLTLASLKDWDHVKSRIEERDTYFEEYLL